MVTTFFQKNKTITKITTLGDRLNVSRKRTKDDSRERCQIC